MIRITRSFPSARRSGIAALGLLLAALAGTAQAATYAIRDVRVHTLAAAGTLERATVIVRNDRIEAVGSGVAVPEGATVVDGARSVLTPGLFDAYTQIGLKEVDGVAETTDEDSGDPRFSAALDASDGLNPRSSLVAINRIEGITRAMSAPTAGDRNMLLSGLGALINLGSVEAFAMRPRSALFAQLGEAGASRVGGSRLAALALLREALAETRDPDLWRGRPNRMPLLSPLDQEALKGVLAGEVPLVALAHRASDIQALLRLAEQFSLRLIIRGGAEAHLAARALAEARVPVILDPTYTLPSHFETLAARADAPAILQRAGVLIAISTEDDKGSHNSRNIRQLAGNAVARGLPYDAALAAITLNPARIYGVDYTLGSIEPGKIADLVLWDGDPLEVTSAARQVWIDGRAVSMESRQTRLRERYLERLRRAIPQLP